MSEGRLLLRPNGDVLAAGREVRVSEAVPGDAMAAGGTVVFDGAVGGSYVGAGGRQDIRGRMDGSVRAAGGTVELGASVGRNVTIAGGTVTLGRETEIERNAYLAGGTVHVDGAVDGDMYVGAEEVVLDGVVGGDVRVEAQRLTLGPNARLSGDLRYRTADGTATIDAQAQIVGRTDVLPPREDDGPGGAIVFFVLRLLAFVLTGTIVVSIFPGTVRTLGETVGARTGASLGAGIVGLLAVPLAVLLAAATLVGLPLAAITGALFAILLYLAPVVPAVWLGGALFGDQRGDQRRRFLSGGPILALAMFIPWVGLLFRLLAISLGLGAVALSLFASDRGGEVSA